MADDYQSLAIRRQVLLERLKSGQFKEFSAVFKELERLIKSAFVELDYIFEDMSRTRLENLIQKIRKDQGAIFAAAIESFTVQLFSIAQIAQAQEILDLKKTLDLRGTKLNQFTKIDLQKLVLKRPLSTNGQLLSSFIKDFSDNETERVANVIRLAWSQGKTNSEAVDAVLGITARGSIRRGGAMDTIRRNASSVVRTSIQHVASSARMEIWKTNPDVVRRYRWLSTLDRRTSGACKALDRQEFEFDKGPVPPIHPNCRSTTLPITNPKYDFLDVGKTRSAEFGPVAAETDYYQWLKRQNPEVVKEALGPTRAKLFLDGGMSADRFRELQFDRNFEPLTLAEMRKIVPEAFSKAGL